MGVIVSDNFSSDKVAEFLNKAEISQWGNNENTAVQTQTNIDGSTMLNEAITWQNGYSNDAVQTQIGGNNYSKIDQSNNHNNAIINQTMSLIP